MTPMWQRDVEEKLGLIFIGLFVAAAGLAFADEKIEMSTYVPAASNSWDRVHANRATIGSPYSITNPAEPNPPDGTLLVNGNVGIGTQAPIQRLDVIGGIRYGRQNGAASDGGFLCTTAPGNYGGREAILTVADGVGNNSDEIWIGVNTGAVRGNLNLVARDVWCQGTAHNFSDLRMKTDIAAIPNALERICALRGVNFHWKGGGEKPALEMGVIGQEVEPVFPELVRTNPQGMKFVSYNNLSAALIEAVKELKIQNEAQEREILALRKELGDVTKRVSSK